MPFVVVGLLESSMIFVSISTWRVGLSSWATSVSTDACSFSVATTTNWLVRTSGKMRLRLSVRPLETAAVIVSVLAYLSWMTRVINGGGALGSFWVILA